MAEDATVGTSPLERPLRWGQLTLVENDPGRFDPAFWLDYFRRCRCEGALLSAGGVVAYYPTEVPLHHRSEWLGESDPFGELVAGCREIGMSVVARLDPHAVHQPIADAHPDWIACDAEGRPMPHWSRPEMWLACTIGPYGFEHMSAVAREIVVRYGVDGVFANRWSSPAMCYCPHCAADFREATGLELPPPDADRRGEPWRRYLAWKRDRLAALWDAYDAAVRSARPEARFIPNIGASGHLLDKETVARKSAMLFIDDQGRSGLRCPWSVGRNGKQYRATFGRKPLIGLFSVGLETRYRWKDSVQSEAELRVWVAGGIANGLRPMFCKFAAVLHDRRWLDPVERIFAWHGRHARYMRNERSLADVAMAYSQRADWLMPEAERRGAHEHADGFYQALVEARVPFDMVYDGALSAEALAPYRVLVLPSIAFLSDEECDELRRFVAAGGSLVATYETSLYDGAGRRREDFGLADLFGLRYVEHEPGPIKNAYLLVEDPAHPLLRGMEDAGRLIGGAHRLEVEPTHEFTERPLTHVPPYPDLPMEDVYPRVERTDVPAVFVREGDGARVAYFNWDADRLFWEVLNPDHGRLLANAVRWAARGELPVTVEGPGVVEVTAWRQADSLTVHLVNLTNPMLMRGALRELLPLGEQVVRLRLPDASSPARVHLLKAERDAEFVQRGDVLEARVPSVLDHEVLAVDL